VEPILIAKCSPCHTRTDPPPASGFAITYESSQLPSNSATCDVAGEGEPRISQGACIILRIHDATEANRMPRGKGCTGDPVADAGNTSCLTAEEQQTIINWLADGQEE
jgi:hypothetical protein